MQPQKNRKKLYQCMTKLSGQNKLNPLPDSTSNEELAEIFTYYFLEKILNIRKFPDGLTNYTPNSRKVPELNKFFTLTESQLYRIIMEMPSKMYDQDLNSYRIPKEGTWALYNCNNQSCQFIIKHRGPL